jgi:hypothetical protein
MSNPIGFSDLFDANDRDVILQMIKDVRELKAGYADFINTVTGPAIAQFNSQQKEMAVQIGLVATATKDLSVTNREHQKTLLDNLTIISNLRAENEALRKSKEGAKQVEDALAGSVNALKQQLADQVKEWRAMKVVTDQDIASRKNLAASISQTRTELKGLNDETKATTVIFAHAKGSYNELDAITKQLTKDYKALGDVQGANKVQAEAMAKQISDNTARLKAFDATIGNNFRNVGNYKSGFDGLSNSISQILREAPAAAISLNTFFLAISNNLPIFFDELKRISVAQKAQKVETEASIALARESAIQNALLAGATREAAIAEGELAVATVAANAAAVAAPGVWSRILSSLFSFNTLLTLGVLGLTFFGARIVNFIGSLFTFGNAMSDAATKTKLFADVNQAAFKSVGDNILQLKLLYSAATTTAEGIDAQREAAEKLQATYPNTFANFTKEEIMLGKAKDGYDKLTNAILINARVAATRSQLSTLEAQRLTVEAEKENIRAKAEEKKTKARGGRTDFAAMQVANIITKAENKDLKEQDKILGDIDKKEQFLIGFTGKKNLLDPGAAEDVKAADDSLNGLRKQLSDLRTQYDALGTSSANFGKRNDELIPKIKALETEIKRREDLLSIKPPKSTSDKEARELERTLRKQDELIQASVKYQIAQEELRFAQSGKTFQDEMNFENKKIEIQREGFRLRADLWAKDSRHHTQVLGEQLAAEADHVNKVQQIRAKDIDQREALAMKEVQASYDRTNKGFVAEIEFEDKKLQVVEAATAERIALYAKDSDEYAAALEQKEAAEAAHQNRITAIRKAQAEGRQEVDIAVEGVSTARQVGVIQTRQARGELSPEDAARQLHNINVATMTDEIARQQEKLKTLKDGDMDYLNTQKEIANLEKGLIEENTNYEVAQAEKGS